MKFTTYCTSDKEIKKVYRVLKSLKIQNDPNVIVINATKKEFSVSIFV